MSDLRPAFKRAKLDLLFKHSDYPDDKYLILHPTYKTISPDIVLLPEKIDVETSKHVVIPADKSILKMVPYFSAQLNENHNWRELKNDNGSSFIEMKIRDDFNLEPKTIFHYIEHLYNNQKLEFITTESCIQIFQLSNFWSDDHISKRSEKFIKQNMNKNILKQIMKNPQLQDQLDSLVNSFLNFAEELIFSNPEISLDDHDVFYFETIDFGDSHFELSSNSKIITIKDNPENAQRLFLTNKIFRFADSVQLNFRLNCPNSDGRRTNIFCSNIYRNYRI